MAGIRSRSPLKTIVAALSAACFLAFAQGAVTYAVAADPVPPSEPSTVPPAGSTWETWPPKKPIPGVESPATAGEFGGQQTSSGISAGTWGWIAGGAAAAILIGVAVSGGGGGSSTTPSH
jgi:hypothetical protein